MTDTTRVFRKFGGFLFRVENDVEQPLLRALVAEDEAQNTAEGIFVPDARIASFAPWELKQLGLPPAAPFRLQVRGEGAIASEGFRLLVGLLRSDGRPVTGGRRDGVVFKSGSREYLLLNPLYEVLEKASSFSAASTMDERMLRWCDLRDLLPEGSVVDRQLQTINLVRGDAFTLDIKPGADFDPVLLTVTNTDAAGDHGENREPSEALPESSQETFSERFAKGQKVNGHYALGGGWYVTLPAETRSALEVVREIKQSPLNERQAFIANPHAVLKDRLKETVDEPIIDSLFLEQEQFLSSRIKCLGVWQPKLCAYVPNKEMEWIPEDVVAFSGKQLVGVSIDNHYFNIALDDAPQIVADIEQARAEGKQTVTYAGQSIPVSEESQAALLRLTEKKSPSSATKQSENEIETRPEELVPVLIDNLEELGFTANKRTTSVSPGGLPSSLKTTTLYPHQEQGIHWLQSSWAEGMPGVLLADDMGLGKTLQVLTFLAWLKEQMETGAQDEKPFLIVAPTGLLKNWEKEEKTHLLSPGLGTLIRAYGKDLKALEEQGSYHRTQALREADWVLTTYETLRDRIQNFLPVDWAVVAFDEAQKIKNPASRMTDMAKSLQTDFTVAITGTPVENSLQDLWSIMDTAHPGLLGALKDFRNIYQKPAEEKGEVERARELRKVLEEQVSPPAILRRMKDEHLRGLPERREHVIKENMPEAQAGAYSESMNVGAQNRGRAGGMLEAIQGLRKVSLLADDLAEKGLTDELVANSARLSATMKVLDQIKAKGEKVLIFIEFINLQEALIPYLTSRYGLDMPPLRINGKINSRARQKMVDDFQSRLPNEFDVMLISPKAGGVGLTLTAANHVIHLSRWWNPAVEDQCTDRVYRIGQAHDEVHVYYPLAIHPDAGEHSFDLNLHKLLTRKRELSHNVLASPEVTKEELGELFQNSFGEI